MAIPILLPNESTTLQRLFAEMPQSFSRNPESVETLRLYLASSSNDDKISITISDGKMYINSSLSYIDSEVLYLYKYTINDIINYFNGKYGIFGITASRANGVTYADANYLASTLLEGIYDVGSTEIIIDRFTSPNYALMSAIALGLIENSDNMFAAIQQTDVRQSTGKWIDYWGHLLGIDRFGSELNDDIGYRNRIQRDAVDQKSNNIAIEKLSEAATSRNTNVVDGGRPFLLSGSYNPDNPLPTLGSALAIGRTSVVTFSGYIDGTVLHVQTNPVYESTILQAMLTPGFVLSGVGVSNDTIITELVTGSGWTGLYTVSPIQNVGDSTNLVSFTASYPATVADASYRIGPTTGAGSFIIYVQKFPNESVLPQSLTASLSVLVNQWKPAGISFVIESL